MNKIIKTAFFFAGYCMFVLAAYAHEGHEHVEDAPIYVKWGFEGLTQMQNIHPIIVHFPIALLLVATFFYILGTILKKEEFYFGGKWLLYLGTISAVIACVTGLQAAAGVSHDEESHLIMMPHQYLGIGIAIVSFVFSVWVFRSKLNIPKQRKTFLLGMILLSGLIGQQGDLGGRLVYLKGVGVGKKGMQHQGMQQGNKANPASKKWEEIESHREHLKTTIESGGLEKVHAIAFKIRDLTLTLPIKDLSSDQKIVFQSLTDEIQKQAALLDGYGDAGDQARTQEQFEKFSQTLQSIKNLYGKSKEVNAQDMSNMKM